MDLRLQSGQGAAFLTAAEHHLSLVYQGRLVLRARSVLGLWELQRGRKAASQMIKVSQQAKQEQERGQGAAPAAFTFTQTEACSAGGQMQTRIQVQAQIQTVQRWEEAA